MNFFLFMSIITLCSCTANLDKKEAGKKNNDCYTYPVIVDSLHLKDFYDSARWYIYTWNCDQRYLPKKDSSISITYGELALRFKSIAIKHDTLDFIFDFIDEDEAILLSMKRDSKETSTGVGFNINTKVKVYMMYANTTVVEKGVFSRYETPLQPDVLAYIKNNWDELNPCFRALAEQKGIMK